MWHFNDCVSFFDASRSSCCCFLDVFVTIFALKLVSFVISTIDIFYFQTFDIKILNFLCFFVKNFRKEIKKTCWKLSLFLCLSLLQSRIYHPPKRDGKLCLSTHSYIFTPHTLFYPGLDLVWIWKQNKDLKKARKQKKIKKLLVLACNPSSLDWSQVMIYMFWSCFFCS